MPIRASYPDAQNQASALYPLMLITQLSLNLLCHPALLSLALPSLAQFSALKQGHVLPHRAPTYVKDVQPTFLLHPSQCLPTFVILQWISSPGTADLSPQHFRIAQVVLLLLITFMCTLPAAQSGAPWSFFCLFTTFSPSQLLIFKRSTGHSDHRTPSYHSTCLPQFCLFCF